MQEEIRSLLTYFLTLTLIVLTATGCGRERHIAHDLENIAAVMEINPDSAYRMLGLIDSASLRGSNAALYILLDAQARQKLSLPLPPDSALDPVIEYFAGHHADSLLMKSLFYRACINSSHKNLQDAIRDANYSFEIASSINKDYWQAKNAELIADIFEDCINYADGISWRKTAADRYHSAGMTDNYLFALCDLARAYAVADSLKQAGDLFNRIEREVDLHPEIDNLKVYYTFAALNFHTLYADDSTGALCDSLYGYLKKSEMIEYLPPTFNIARARMLTDNFRFAEAENILDSIKPFINSDIDRNILFDSYVRLYSSSGNKDGRMAYSDSIIAYQKNIVRIALDQSATAAQRNFFQSLSNNYKIEAEKDRIHLRNILIITALIIAASVWITIRHLKAKRREINEKRALIEIISEQLESKDHTSDQLRQQLDEISKINNDLNKTISIMNQSCSEQIRKIDEQKELLGIKESELRTQQKIAEEQNNIIRSMKDIADETGKRLDSLSKKLSESEARNLISYADRWEPLNALCREINCSDNKNSDKIIVANLRKVIDGYRSKGFLHKLENDLNRDYNNIVGRLRTQCLELKDDDIYFCILNFSKMPSASIAIITGASITNCYVRRKRIRNKIIRSSAPDKEEFLSHIKG